MAQCENVREESRTCSCSDACFDMVREATSFIRTLVHSSRSWEYHQPCISSFLSIFLASNKQTEDQTEQSDRHSRNRGLSTSDPSKTSPKETQVNDEQEHTEPILKGSEPTADELSECTVNAYGERLTAPPPSPTPSLATTETSRDYHPALQPLSMNFSLGNGNKSVTTSKTQVQNIKQTQNELKQKQVEDKFAPPPPKPEKSSPVGQCCGVQWRLTTDNHSQASPSTSETDDVALLMNGDSKNEVKPNATLKKIQVCGQVPPHVATDDVTASMNSGSNNYVKQNDNKSEDETSARAVGTSEADVPQSTAENQGSTLHKTERTTDSVALVNTPSSLPLIDATVHSLTGSRSNHGYLPSSGLYNHPHHYCYGPQSHYHPHPGSYPLAHPPQQFQPQMHPQQDLSVYSNVIPQGMGITMGFVTGIRVPLTNGNAPNIFTANSTSMHLRNPPPLQQIVPNTAGMIDFAIQRQSQISHVQPQAHPPLPMPFVTRMGNLSEPQYYALSEASLRNELNGSAVFGAGRQNR